MDKELLKKYHLQEAVKRFNQINEYTFITSPMLSEDGEDENTPPNEPNMPQTDNNGTPNNNDMAMDNGNQMPMNGNNANQGDLSPNNAETDGNLPNDEEMPPEGLEMGDNDIEDNDSEEEIETTEEEEGDEVIDVDDLTNSQEVAEIKIDGVDDKLTRMLNVLNKFSAALEQSDKKIEDLKKEFEKRNPSEQEKLNIRSQSSYPYSETPKDYWDKKKSEDSRYNVIYDNDVSTAKEQEKFNITKDDVSKINVNDIAKSFDLDNELNIDDYLKF